MNVLDAGVIRPATAEELAEIMARAAQPEPVPFKIPRKAALLTLHAAGHLATLRAMIDAQPEPQRTEYMIQLEDSESYIRNDPFVALMGGMLGLTSDEIDNLFRETLKVK